MSIDIKLGWEVNRMLKRIAGLVIVLSLVTCVFGGAAALAYDPGPIAPGAITAK